MRKIYFFLFGALLFLSLPLNILYSKQIFNYESILKFVSPVPGSELNSRYTNIILKFKDKLNINFYKKNLKVIGTVSGLHKGSLEKSDEQNTIIFKPYEPFKEGETIKVTIRNVNDNENNNPLLFEFKISPNKQNIDLVEFYKNEFENYNIKSTNIFNSKKYLNENDSLPPDFPVISISNNNNPTQGKIFLSNFLSSTPYLIILDNSGNPISYKKMSSVCMDFKPYSSTVYTYFGNYNLPNSKFYSIDSTFNLIDSFMCGNGYSTDVHELRILPNGHALLMSYDGQIIDMSKIVSGGNPNALVVGLILQEIDNNKNVVWQWRSWDHYKITDATHENLDSSFIDYVHGNAIEVDKDGNILVSCRHLDEITKINYQDGSIIWRLGGKNNQFTFINDTLKFSHQHAIRLLPNGNYTLFDNGNYHNPPFSRAIEYSINEQSKTCTKVWEYRNIPTSYGFAMGYVQRLSNGNTLIGWGATNPTITEVTQSGEKVLELSFPQNVFSYRAYKLESNGYIASIHSQPNKYFLNQNYPNPFNPSTNIEYYIPVQAKVKLQVFDLTGQLVATLVNELQDYGRYAVKLNNVNLSSGIYFYKLDVNDFSDSKKLVIVK